MFNKALSASEPAVPGANKKAHVMSATQVAAAAPFFTSNGPGENSLGSSIMTIGSASAFLNGLHTLSCVADVVFAAAEKKLFLPAFSCEFTDVVRGANSYLRKYRKLIYTVAIINDRVTN